MPITSWAATHQGMQFFLSDLIYELTRLVLVPDGTSQFKADSSELQRVQQRVTMMDWAGALTL